MATATPKQRRRLDKWKVRYCPHCRQYEYDIGSPRGWVKLQGGPPGAEGEVAVVAGSFTLEEATSL